MAEQRSRRRAKETPRRDKTQQELRRLSRADLLEILLAQSREIDSLRAQLAAAQSELADRQIRTERAGSIAEAALELNGVFEAAQRAADQYLENIARLAGEQSSTASAAPDSPQPGQGKPAGETL